MAVREATDEDWIAMFGEPAPSFWFGLVEASAWMVEGIGAVFLGTDGRWWMSFQRAPGVRKTKTAHACAKRLIALARERGLEVYALANSKIGGAELWIRRLGFESVGTLNGNELWQIR